jgi:hypothetical protein
LLSISKGIHSNLLNDINLEVKLDAPLINRSVVNFLFNVTIGGSSVKKRTLFVPAPKKESPEDKNV